jgi:hypothetical protein
MSKNFLNEKNSDRKYNTQQKRDQGCENNAPHMKTILTPRGVTIARAVRRRLSG